MNTPQLPQRLTPDSPRAATVEEVRAEFLNHVRGLVAYWASDAIPADQGLRERLDGLAFSMLTTIDGCSLALPTFDLVARPHPDDEAFHKEEGDNWIPDGLVINEDVHLHDFFYEKK